MRNITIIIPTYTNIGGFIKLINKLKTGSCPIVVIDNLPTEEKHVFIQSLIINNKSSIVYLPQKINIGFARAINLGVKHAKTEWILILNDDAVIKDNKIFERLMNFARKNNSTAVSPVLKDSHGIIENLGYRVLPIGRVELNFDKKDIIDQHVIDGLTAACLLIKKKDLESLGGFDERFFAYLEDVDLFLRMKKKGYTFGVDTNSTVIHDKNTTSSKMGNFKQKQDLKNWFLVIGNNWDWKTLFHFLPGIFIERLRNLSGYLKSFK